MLVKSSVREATIARGYARRSASATLVPLRDSKKSYRMPTETGGNK
jgi:hypothetical protein